MTEAIYKVGDILELDGNASFPRQFGMFPKDAKIRCMVLKCIKPGYEFIIYTLLVYKIDGSFDTVGINQKDLVVAAKRVGHIDISSFLSDEESAEPDYAMFFTAATIAQAADLRNENKKLKVELAEETLKRTQAEVELDEKAEELDRVYHSDMVCENNKLRNENEVLKRENEELRGHNEKLYQELLKLKGKADSRLDEIAFLIRKVDEVENERDKLKTKCDEANHEISRLRTVIGGLNDVIDDLNDSKSEISDLFCSLKSTLQTDDILDGVNKLKKENERLSNENGDLKTMNDELRKSIPEYNKLVLEHFACTEKIKKLEAENARYLQSMTCARKQMTEAAKRICEAEEHIDVALCNN